jgi:Domain of unknown function (DUF1918)
MRADVGDSLVVKGATNGDPDQRGNITECAHGRRHARLHGSLARTGHQALAFPGADSIVVRVAQQQAADERTRSRLMSSQAVLTGHASK